MKAAWAWFKARVVWLALAIAAGAVLLWRLAAGRAKREEARADGAERSVEREHVVVDKTRVIEADTRTRVEKVEARLVEELREIEARPDPVEADELAAELNRRRRGAP